MNRYLLAASLLAASISAIAFDALAQGLPAPTRTVYKCQDGSRIHYSDSPCIGATRKFFGKLRCCFEALMRDESIEP